MLIYHAGRWLSSVPCLRICLRIRPPIAGIVLLAGLLTGFQRTDAQDHVPTPEDIALAISNPDEFAWQLFMDISHQAEMGKAGWPDTTKSDFRDYDDDSPVVWETWALASGGRVLSHYAHPNRSEVFLDRGAQPAEWSSLERQKPAPKYFEMYPGKGVEFLVQNGRHLGAFDPVEDGGEGGIEVRMNRALFDYVRDNTLYNVEGLEARVRSGDAIDTPTASKEIKARWVPITDADKPRYHWRMVTKSDGTIQYWGLSALHIITRDLPNWFWCDFEHVDFERNAEQYSRDTTTRGEQPTKGNHGVRQETVGTKWETMRLRGTQVDFVDTIGRPTILANSQLEHGFQQTASCITCHSRATVGLRVNRPDLPKWQVDSLPSELAANPTIRGAVGAPDPDWFRNERGEMVYTQTHFVWSIPFRALSTKVDPE
ncbi:MAG: hypothetical protein ACR2NZ_25725 [Rubripirellula sp.]